MLETIEKAASGKGVSMMSKMSRSRTALIECRGGSRTAPTPPYFGASQTSSKCRFVQCPGGGS